MGKYEPRLAGLSVFVALVLTLAVGIIFHIAKSHMILRGAFSRSGRIEFYKGQSLQSI